MVRVKVGYGKHAEEGPFSGVQGATGKGKDFHTSLPFLCNYFHPASLGKKGILLLAASKEAEVESPIN